MKNTTMKKIIFKTCITALVLLWGIAVIAFSPECLFKKVFGINCPSCGMTRAFAFLFKGDVLAAFKSHFMFWSIPALVIISFWFDGKISKNRLINILLYAFIALGFMVNYILHSVL